MRPDRSQPDNPNDSTPNVDSYFDRELTPESIESLFDSMNQSRAQRDQFDDTQSMLDDLRNPVEAPDFSGQVLGEVGQRRGWLSSKGRRMVFVGRLATAACLLLVVSGLLLVRRNNPEAFQPATTSGPVSEFVEASGVEAGASMRALSEGLLSIEEKCQPTVKRATISVSVCETRCGKSRTRVQASARQDFSTPLSPGLGDWLSAGNVELTIVVSSFASHQTAGPGHDTPINNWLIAPERSDRLPSFEASSVGGPRLINVADWTATGSQGR